LAGSPSTGIAAASYHGQMKAAERHENQDRFMRGDLKVMVATNENKKK